MKYYRKRRNKVRFMYWYMTLYFLLIAGLVIGRLSVYAKESSTDEEGFIIVKAEPIDEEFLNIPVVTERITEQLEQSSNLKEEEINSELLCPEESNDGIEVETLDNINIEISIDDIVIDISDVTKISNATPDMIESALAGTWLEGYGSLYYELEHEYNVNAFLAIGNAIQETGWKGNSTLAVNDNNIYGMNNKKFDSKEDCINYYFRLINKHYVGEGYISLEQINGKYCPPDDTWDNDIYSIAKKLKSKVSVTPN